MVPLSREENLLVGTVLFLYPIVRQEKASLDPLIIDAKQMSYPISW